MDIPLKNSVKNKTDGHYILLTPQNSDVTLKSTLILHEDQSPNLVIGVSSTNVHIQVSVVIWPITDAFCGELGLEV